MKIKNRKKNDRKAFFRGLQKYQPVAVRDSKGLPLGVSEPDIEVTADSEVRP